MPDALMVIKGKMQDTDLQNSLARLIPKYARDFVSPSMLLQIAFDLVKSDVAKNGERRGLITCEPTSIIRCMVTAATLLLKVEPTLGQFYIVPFSEDGSKNATPIIGYKGFSHLEWQSGLVKSMDADIVLAADEFEYSQGDGGRLFHRPHPTADRTKEELWIGAYHSVELTTGGQLNCYMNIHEIHAHRARSAGWRSGKSNPWRAKGTKQAPDTLDVKWMYIKTPIRTNAKMMPLSPVSQSRGGEEFRATPQHAAAIDEMAEAGVSVPSHDPDGDRNLEDAMRVTGVPKGTQVDVGGRGVHEKPPAAVRTAETATPAKGRTAKPPKQKVHDAVVVESTPKGPPPAQGPKWGEFHGHAKAARQDNIFEKPARISKAQVESLANLIRSKKLANDKRAVMQVLGNHGFESLSEVTDGKAYKAVWQEIEDLKNGSN